MATEPRSRRRRRKKILRRTDGSLYDVTERHRITPAELRDYVRDGGLFEARRDDSGGDCTYEVLQDVLGVGLLQNLLPGAGGGFPGLGGLGALTGGGGALAALGGAGGLADLMRVIADQGGRRSDPGWDDHDEPRRRSPRRASGDGAWGDGDWSDEAPRPSPGGDRSDEHRRPSAGGDGDWAGDSDVD
ncbi:MAG: hypothetical protein QOF96_2639 [Actinomycetota bacterium]|nr:hypothetical protein [Actinomycetota bacterium]